MEDESHLVVRSSQSVVGAGQVVEAHGHAWPQLIYASRGVMTVWTEQGSWIAPPHWAILAPAHVRHSIRFSGESRLDTLYLQPACAWELPGRCTVALVSPLLRELILEAARRRMLDGRDAGDAALTRMLLDSLRFDARSPFDLPQPTSTLARTAAVRMQAEPAASMTAIVEELGITRRTLERRSRRRQGSASEPGAVRPLC